MNNFYKKLFLCFIVIQSIFINVCYSATLQAPYLLEMLEGLKVADDCQIPQYVRKDWRHWIDEDENGLDARQEVLLLESLIIPRLNDNGSKVIVGRWYDPYADLLFTKPESLDIDHFVPLGEAHKSGGCNWSAAKKRRYANAFMHK